MAGQPSAELLAELRQAGAGLTEDQMLDALEHAETARTSFQVAAVRVGTLLLAKQQTIAHGGWRPWCEQFARLAAVKVEACFHFGLRPELTLRSLRTYAALARHFLADLEQGRFQPEAKDAAVTPPAVTPAEVLALDSLPQDKRLAVLDAIDRFVAGRSLRRMLQDFRRAEEAANTEELADTVAHQIKPKQQADDPAQLTFFEDLKGALTVLDTLLESPEFKTHATRDQLMRMADALEAHAKALRAQAKETAS